LDGIGISEKFKNKHILAENQKTGDGNQKKPARITTSQPDF
jgi:hypothetical protein